MGTFVVPHIHVSITGKGIILGLLVPDGLWLNPNAVIRYISIGGHVEDFIRNGMSYLSIDRGPNWNAWYVGIRYNRFLFSRIPLFKKGRGISYGRETSESLYGFQEVF